MPQAQQRSLFDPPPRVLEAHTYDEWQKLGYHVVRGETHTGRNAASVATFTIAQVEENVDPRDYCRFDDWDWEENWGDR